MFERAFLGVVSVPRRRAAFFHAREGGATDDGAPLNQMGRFHPDQREATEKRMVDMQEVLSLPGV